VANFIEPLLEHRARHSLKIFCFMSGGNEDAYSQRLRALADGWHNVKDNDDAGVASSVARERVDVLIDLAGLTGGNRLGALARRPAPVLITYLGYPNTTGMPCVDFRVVDSMTDPPGSEARCTERLLRLDPCFLCFQPARDAPDPTPPPSLAGAPPTFCSFNTLLKLSDVTVAAWGGVMARVPGSRLLLKCTQVMDPDVRAATLARFAAHSVDPARVEFLAVTPTAREHLALYARADVALDPFPYHGTTTTCEALWMGVPVVTLRGEPHASRVGATILTNAGFPELVADSVDDYIATAAALASDPRALGALRALLRPRMAASPLRDGPGFAQRFERLLRGAYAAS
jgi:predicted O-linked N-acetylglucosamine transferase (SPINDLY family)